MKNMLMLPALAVALSACSMMTPMKSGDAMMMMSHTLSKQPAGMALNSSGTVTPKMEGTMVMTEAKVMGLAPSTYYVAHYHSMGTASAEPCSSNGPAIMASKIVGMTDAAGMLMLKGSVAKADVMAAKYFNIHTATGADGTPADAGVSCTALDVAMMK
ncbi:superoxide dismutase [Deinococcus arenicola]|uniref:Superoxide dismutase n=1 Tax=Deinococcus arenicola TaxID=2994950 RepID=A0ABU4DP64_9DEIO|nr:superoxide dismutase [Deinococcus sp. ZS9-10]MDV6373685.1 superoxide dismutase [Deinococcus sp. ZS9-10]